MSEGREEGGAQVQAEVRRRGADYVILLRPDSSTGSRVRGCLVPVLGPWLLKGLRSPLRRQLRPSCHLNMDSASQGTSRWAWTASHSGGRGSAPLGPLSLYGSDSRPLSGRQALDLKAPDGRGVSSVLPRRLGLPWDRPEAAFLGALPVPGVCELQTSPCAVRHLRPSIFRWAPGNTPSGVGL